jgi:ubiquinone/menaquinone biosynthesis C-methylase UbiE
MATEAQRYWGEQASTFDQEPDHGLRDPDIRQAWCNLLKSWLPTAPAAILDIGCGTGSLSLLLASLGHTVTGLDFSAEMLAQAQAKAAAAGYATPFLLQNAAAPQLAAQQFDVIVCRHLLWALPQPAQVLQRWVRLLKPGGQLLLIEGYWHTGGGLHAQEVVAALPSGLINVTIQPLHDQSELWGKSVSDERYAVMAQLAIHNERLP